MKIELGILLTSVCVNKPINLLVLSIVLTSEIKLLDSAMPIFWCSEKSVSLLLLKSLISWYSEKMVSSSLKSLVSIFWYSKKMFSSFSKLLILNDE